MRKWVISVIFKSKKYRSDFGYFYARWIEIQFTLTSKYDHTRTFSLYWYPFRTFRHSKFLGAKWLSQRFLRRQSIAGRFLKQTQEATVNKDGFKISKTNTWTRMFRFKPVFQAIEVYPDNGSVAQRFESTKIFISSRIENLTRYLCSPVTPQTSRQL